MARRPKTAGEGALLPPGKLCIIVTRDDVHDGDLTDGGMGHVWNTGDVATIDRACAEILIERGLARMAGDGGDVGI